MWVFIHFIIILMRCYTFFFNSILNPAEQTSDLVLVRGLLLREIHLRDKLRILLPVLGADLQQAHWRGTLLKGDFRLLLEGSEVRRR